MRIGGTRKKNISEKMTEIRRLIAKPLWHRNVWLLVLTIHVEKWLEEDNTRHFFPILVASAWANAMGKVSDQVVERLGYQTASNKQEEIAGQEGSRTVLGSDSRTRNTNQFATGLGRLRID